MAGRKNGLGRGLDAFFPDRTSVVKEPARKTITKTVKTEKKSDVAEKQTNPTVAKKQTADSKTGAMIVKISSVEPNMDQPRKQFDEDALMELASTATRSCAAFSPSALITLSGLTPWAPPSL